MNLTKVVINHKLIYIYERERESDPVPILPPTAIQAALRIHAMDYLAEVHAGPGRDLTCVELFSGRQTLVTGFRILSQHHCS